MKKIIMFLSAFVFGIIALFSGYNAYAEGTLTGGVQNGVQTQNMTIDEGLNKAIEFLNKVIIKEEKPNTMSWA